MYVCTHVCTGYSKERLIVGEVEELCNVKAERNKYLELPPSLFREQDLGPTN